MLLYGNTCPYQEIFKYYTHIQHAFSATFKAELLILKIRELNINKNHSPHLQTIFMS